MLDFLKVHGTYPFDGPGWKRVRQLTPEEAGRLLGFSEDDINKEMGSEDPCFILNKGFRILEGDAPEAPPLLAAALDIAGMPNTGSRIPVGTQAVYNHDCKYRLIERV